VFILILIFLLLNSFLITGLFGSLCWIEFFTLFIIFFYSQILGISITLGLFNLLYPVNILLFSVFLSILLFPKIRKIKLPELKIIKPKFFILLSVIFSIYISYIFHLMILPPYTTDGLLYHLPFAVHYLKTGSVSLPSLYFTDIAMTYYPIGGEIFYFFSLLSGREFLVKFTQFPFLVLGCFSLFLIMKSFGFSDFLSLVGALFFSLIKPVFLESRMCFVDLIMAATFISTIYLFQKKEKKYIIPGILSLTILLSVKTLSIIFGILTLPFLFFKKEGKIRAWFYFSLVYLVFFGFFSYIRNFILTGNPLYPAEISFGKFVLFEGPYVYPDVSLLEKFKILFRVLAFSSMHIDPSFTLKLLLVVFFIISFILSYRKKDLFIFYSLFPISILLYSLFIPQNYYQIRHLLPVYGILCVSLTHPFKKLEYFFLPVFLYFCIPVLHPEFFLFFLLSLIILLIIFFFAFYFKKPILYPFYFLIFIFTLIFQIEKTTFLYENAKFFLWNNAYKKEVSLWEFVQKNSINGKNIVYVGDFLIYPFYGDKLQNNVYYQSVNSVETLPVHKYKPEKNNSEPFYRKNPSYYLWLEGLKKKKIDWIIVKKEGSYIEKEWIEKNKEKFKLIFSSEFADIYEFNYKVLTDKFK